MWGFDVQASVKLTVHPSNGFPSQSRTVNFVVSDYESGTRGPTCGQQSHRPYAPDIHGGPTVDLGGTSTGTGGDLLAGVMEPDGQAVTAGGYGYVGDPANPYGTYQINPDGTITVTENPANPLATGQQVGAGSTYRAVDSDGKIGLGVLDFTVIG